MNQTERKWCVVCFGDIRGFGSWTASPSASREVKTPFGDRFCEAMGKFVIAHTDPSIHFKYCGDGFMVLREFTRDEKNNGAVARFLHSVQEMSRDARAAIVGCSWPRPDGFRIRITCGDVDKRMLPDPNDPQRKRLIPEYLEYPINAAAHLLQVNPEKTCLAFEGVVEVMNRYARQFKPKPLGRPSCRPVSVNERDMNRLYVLKF